MRFMSENKDALMRTMLIPVTVVTLIASGAAVPVQAKGCLKGAVVGGVAGHMAHHGVLGAVAGCAVGHHYAHKSDHQAAEHQRAGQPSMER